MDLLGGYYLLVRLKNDLCVSAGTVMSQYTALIGYLISGKPSTDQYFEVEVIMVYR